MRPEPYATGLLLHTNQGKPERELTNSEWSANPADRLPAAVADKALQSISSRHRRGPGDFSPNTEPPVGYKAVIGVSTCSENSCSMRCHQCGGLPAAHSSYGRDATLSLAPVVHIDGENKNYPLYGTLLLRSVAPGKDHQTIIPLSKTHVEIRRWRVHRAALQPFGPPLRLQPTTSETLQQRAGPSSERACCHAVLQEKGPHNGP